jgi:hypothetical protein
VLGSGDAPGAANSSIVMLVILRSADMPVVEAARRLSADHRMG